jgi:glycine cleavage system transcriptional repressor
VEHFALSAIGRDRPGILAAVSRVLVDHGINIEDAQVTILRGHFTMTMILGVPDDLDTAKVREDLDDVAGELRFEGYILSPIEKAEPARAAPASHAVTVHGTDHPGIIRAVASVLAEHGVNITELEGRLADGDGPGRYAMTLEVVLPRELDADRLQRTLDPVLREQGVEFSISELQAAAG